MARGTQSGVSGTNLRCWWRRVIAYLLGMILPWSLLSQLLGTLLVGRSAPEGPAGWLADVIAFGLIVVVSALFTSDGQSLTHRLVRLQIRELSGEPASRLRMGLRNIAHLADFGSLGLGFLWPLWDLRGRTFADKLVGTRVESVGGDTTVRN
ncbi:RDD family protein [Georgenia sp. TF02-10]|uniref:RDD family protein n=1 Tax=Georgenia sp. TF02-10 TaxID=2917725 RepID=UPI00352E428C